MQPPPAAKPLIKVGREAGFTDSFSASTMKDHQKMSRSGLPDSIKQLKSEHSRRGKKEQKQAAEAAAEGAERLRAILETAAEGIITIDHRGIIESANPAALNIFGYHRTELIGKNVSVLIPEPPEGAYDDNIFNYLRTGRAHIIGTGREVCGVRKDGTIFPMDLAVSEMKLHDRTLFAGFIRDISARKEAEKVKSLPPWKRSCGATQWSIMKPSACEKTAG